MILYVPRAERPMVPVHCVGELARFGTSQCVAHEAVRVESGSIRGAVCGRKKKKKRFVRISHRNDRVKLRQERNLRVRIFLFVVMYLVAVENKGRVLRYVHPVVHKVLGREVRRRQPERRVRSLDLMGNRRA